MYYNPIGIETYVQRSLFDPRGKAGSYNSIITRSNNHSQWIIEKIITDRWISYVRSLFLKIIGNLVLAPIFRITIRSYNAPGNKYNPVIYVANHESHLDAPSVLLSLPFHVRSKVAVAAAEDHFFKSWIKFLLISLNVNIFPITRRGYCRKNINHIISLLKGNYSILIFPEGTRTRNGKMNAFKKGIGYIIKELNVSVIPVKIENSYKILPYKCLFPKKGEITVTFGNEMNFKDKSVSEIINKLEKSVKDL